MKRTLTLAVLTAVLLGGVAVAGLAEGSSETTAAAYPTKPAEFLIPFGAGGSADVMGRILVQAGEKYFGQPFVPVNKPGAGGGIMYQALKNSKPDGYTIGWDSTSILTATNIGNVPFTYEAFIAVCNVGFTSMPIAVRADSPWKTAQAFVQYAKQNPGKVKIGNAGTGSATHLTAVIAANAAGIDVVHVPLGAGRRVPSLLGGEVEAICVPLPEILSQVRAGQARLLAMPTEKRDPSVPDVPTLKELGYNVVIELFRGIAVPAGTPDPVVNKLADVFQKASADPAFADVAAKAGFNIDYKGPSETAEYLKVQNELIAKGLKDAGLVK